MKNFEKYGSDILTVFTQCIIHESALSEIGNADKRFENITDFFKWGYKDEEKDFNSLADGIQDNLYKIGEMVTNE